MTSTPATRERACATAGPRVATSARLPTGQSFVNIRRNRFPAHVEEPPNDAGPRARRSRGRPLGVASEPMDGPTIPSLDAAIAAGDARRLAVRAALADRTARLPLRYWRQQAHLTTPAADAAMARKAVEGGTAPVGRMLERLGLERRRPRRSARAADRALVEARWPPRRAAPLVMLDGEDAIAPGDEVAARALAVAVGHARDADWGDAGGRQPALLPAARVQPRDDRPRPVHPAVAAPRAHRRATVPARRHRLPQDRAPRGGRPRPRPARPTPRRPLGLPVGPHPGRPTSSSPAGRRRSSPRSPRRAAPRLAALIFGLADYSADLGPAAIGNDHPLADWARAEIVAVAGAVGVPGDRRHDPRLPGRRSGARRRGEPDALARADAPGLRRRGPRAIDLGMLGKWVGHPAQLFAVLLADEAGPTDAALEDEAAKLEAYDAAVAADQGATMIDGVMSDRATDRHARVVLRQATAARPVRPGAGARPRGHRRGRAGGRPAAFDSRAPSSAAGPAR